MLIGSCSVPLTSAQFYPAPGQQAGLVPPLLKGTCVPSTAPTQSPLGGRRPTPELHACPMLSVRVCSPPPWPSGACSTPPASPLPGNMPILLLHLALAVVHCDGRVQAGEAEGLSTPLSASVLVSEPLATSRPPPHGLRPLPLPSSPQPPLTGGFGGGFCSFLHKRKKKAFSFVKGWLCFEGLLFSWFCLVFISPGISSLCLVTSPIFSPALSSSTDATRWQF